MLYECINPTICRCLDVQLSPFRKFREILLYLTAVVFYIPANENENHWILVIAFPNEKLSYDLLNTDFEKKGFRNIINVFNELPRKKKLKHEFPVMEIW